MHRSPRHKHSFLVNGSDDALVQPEGLINYVVDIEIEEIDAVDVIEFTDDPIIDEPMQLPNIDDDDDGDDGIENETAVPLVLISL